MHGISTGREGISRREGQFRFTAPWGALIPYASDAAVFHPWRAARNLFRLLYRPLYYRPRREETVYRRRIESTLRDIEGILLA